MVWSLGAFFRLSACTYDTVLNYGTDFKKQNSEEWYFTIMGPKSFIVNQKFPFPT